MSKRHPIELGQLCSYARQAMCRADSGLSNFPKMLRTIIEERAWEHRAEVDNDGDPTGRYFDLPNLRALIETSPHEGWGEDPKKIEALIKDDAEVLAMYREAMKLENQHDKPKQDTTNSSKRNTLQGTTRAYSISVVQRECDQATIARVLSGELSPNAALVQAGLRENRQVYLSKDPTAAAEKVRKQFGQEYAEAFARALTAQRNEV